MERKTDYKPDRRDDQGSRTEDLEKAKKANALRRQRMDELNFENIVSPDSNRFLKDFKQMPGQ
jgi:hypothetical protein